MIVKLTLIIVFLVLSALTSGCEVAFFSLDKFNLKEENSNRLIKKIEALLEKPKRLLATILISNNFINITIVILFASIDNPLLSSINNPLLETIVEVGIIGMMILFIGDILPKIYANRNPLVFAKVMANPIYFLDRYVLLLFNQPMSKSMSYLESNLSKDNDQISVDKLSQALELTDSNETSSEEKKILTGIVNFGNVETRQIMCPRVDVFAIESNQKIYEIIDELISQGFSRVPVYEENLDKIKGVLYVKDLLPHIEDDNFNWVSLLRKPLYIPENKKLDDLLTEFKVKKIHMAIVVDEYGRTAGLLTIEDVLEQIVGDIEDEYDPEDLPMIQEIGHKKYIVEALIRIEDFNEYFETEFLDEDYDTLGGMLIKMQGKLPTIEEIIKIEDCSFRILEADDRRLSSIEVTLD